MATDAQLIQALENAAARIIGRPITNAERDRLIELFNQSQAANTFSRAREAITNFSNVSEHQLMEKAAASDDTNRSIRDLKDIADNWKK